MNIKYSEQAKTLLKNMPGFDLKAFEEWLNQAFTVGSNNILQYIVEKEAKEKKNGTPLK